MLIQARHRSRGALGEAAGRRRRGRAERRLGRRRSPRSSRPDCRSSSASSRSAAAACGSPANLIVPVGTKLRDLLEACGGLTDDAREIIFGGPMMGVAQANLDAPVIEGNDRHRRARPTREMRRTEALPLHPLRALPRRLPGVPQSVAARRPRAQSDATRTWSRCTWPTACCAARARTSVRRTSRSPSSSRSSKDGAARSARRRSHERRPALVVTASPHLQRPATPRRRIMWNVVGEPRADRRRGAWFFGPSALLVDRSPRIAGALADRARSSGKVGTLGDGSAAITGHAPRAHAAAGHAAVDGLRRRRVRDRLRQARLRRARTERLQPGAARPRVSAGGVPGRASRPGPPSAGPFWALRGDNFALPFTQPAPARRHHRGRRRSAS